MYKKITYLILSIIFLINVIFAQNKQETRQNHQKDSITEIRDSLEIFYEEELNRKVDSVLNIYKRKSQNIINKIDSSGKINLDQLKQDITKLKAKLEQKNQGESQRKIKTEEKYYDYIDALLDYRDKEKKEILGITFGGRKINEFKIKILKNYLDRYFPEKKSAYVRHYLTQIYRNQKNYSQTELSFLKFVYLYADSPAYKKLKNNQLEIILNNSYFQERSSLIVTKVDSIDKNAPMEERYYQFLKLLSNYPSKRVKRNFEEEAYKYLTSTFSEYAPKVNYLLAQYYEDEKEIQYTYLTLKKILVCFPESQVAEKSLYKKAKILSEEFGEHQQAIEGFHAYIEKYPEGNHYKDSYFAIAEIYNKRLKEYELAVDEYKEFAKKFPDSEQSKLALKRTAQTLEDKIKDNRRAVRIYLKIANKYSSQELGKMARIKSGDLYYKEKLYQRAAEQYVKLYSLYPEDKSIVKYLSKAATIYEKKLSDIEKAIEILELIINNYPSSNESQEAQKKLEELRTYGGEEAKNK